MSPFVRYLLLVLPALSCGGFRTLAAQQQPVKIGMLITDRSRAEVVDAARLAIDEANDGREPGGKRFELVVRTTEGPWGAGSKESVALVYEDSVWAILGSVDGRNAHLAEQVAARSHITYLETRATDPTLSQAYVPWFLRCVPSDDQQSKAILGDLSGPGEVPLAVLYTSGYDSRMALKSFQRIAAALEDGPRIIPIHMDSLTPLQVLGELSHSKIHHLVITVHSPGSMEVASHAGKSVPGIRIYGTHAFAAGIDPALPPGAAGETLKMVSANSLLNPEGERFRSSYRNRYGKLPGIDASYAYDGMCLIIQAIQRAWPERESVRDHLRQMHFSGVTGPISFDPLGNREEKIILGDIEKVLPVRGE